MVISRKSSFVVLPVVSFGRWISISIKSIWCVWLVLRLNSNTIHLGPGPSLSPHYSPTVIIVIFIVIVVVIIEFIVRWECECIIWCIYDSDEPQRNCRNWLIKYLFIRKCLAAPEGPLHSYDWIVCQIQHIPHGLSAWCVINLLIKGGRVEWAIFGTSSKQRQPNELYRINLNYLFERKCSVLIAIELWHC